MVLKSPEIISLGRISVAFLFSMFLIHSFSSLLQVLHDLKSAAFDSWDKTAWEEVEDFEKRLGDPHHGESYHEPEPWIAHYYDQRVIKKTALTRIARTKEIYELSKLFLIKYAFAIATSLIAFFAPTSAGKLVSLFVIG